MADRTRRAKSFSVEDLVVARTSKGRTRARTYSKLQDG